MQCSTRNPMKLARALALSWALLFLAAGSLSLVAGSAFAQDIDPIGGFASLSVAGTVQDSKLGKGAGSLNDAVGGDLKLGFFPQDWIAVNVGYTYQYDDDYETHFIPLEVRVYAPLGMDQIRVYGQGGLGFFFSRLSGGLDAEENSRASAIRIGAGVELELTEKISAVMDASFIKGLGSASDYEYGQFGLGLLYNWDF